ncbi:MAG: fabD [Chlamydiia bacterium]|nr:fabD [Chlamydiia bacterium]
MGSFSFNESGCMKKITFIFPGQGAQYPGMGRDFYDSFPAARRIFEEADDILQHKLSDIIFHKGEAELTETKNSQPAIYVTSLALLKVLEELFPKIAPFACAGLSLGEYTALTASKKLSLRDNLPLVQSRGRYMHEACEKNRGTMAVILGLEDAAVEEAVRALHLPQDLWCANFNCPGQVVISGTVKGVEEGSKACLAKGAKRALPLQVHGAFHSGLMQSAQDQLKEMIFNSNIKESPIKFASNVTGELTEAPTTIKELLIRQVTSPVRWQKAIRTLDDAGTELFIEIGCGKTLAAMNKRIGVKAPTLNLEKVEDLKTLEQELASL